MTLADMKKLLRAYMNDKRGDRWRDADDVTVVTLLNRAQEDVQDIIDSVDERFFSKGQDYTVAATFDAYEFDLPSDFKVVVGAERIVPNEPPIPATWCSFADRHTAGRETFYGAATDTPLLYLRGNKIGVVNPTTGYTLRVWYTKRIPDLALEADVSEIPVQHHSFVALHAARLAYGSENRDFSRWETEYNRRATVLSEFMESRQRQEPKGINVIEGLCD